ncbi:MAG: hypothetical protein JOZ38_02320 [Candidatus Eremiobacteraeota bacterium]|nr:hypothetical protein [Candidatus Eremiobacteraeota bacterium]
MPRQIIDTESSRPAYVRRNVLTAVVVATILIVAVALAVLHPWQHARNPNVPAGGAPRQSGGTSGHS